MYNLILNDPFLKYNLIQLLCKFNIWKADRYFIRICKLLLDSYKNLIKNYCFFKFQFCYVSKFLLLILHFTFWFLLIYFSIWFWLLFNCVYPQTYWLVSSCTISCWPHIESIGSTIPCLHFVWKLHIRNFSYKKKHNKKRKNKTLF